MKVYPTYCEYPFYSNQNHPSKANTNLESKNLEFLCANWRVNIVSIFSQLLLGLQDSLFRKSILYINIVNLLTMYLACNYHLNPDNNDY